MPAVLHHSGTDTDQATHCFMKFIVYILPSVRITHEILLKLPNKRLFQWFNPSAFPSSSPALTFPSPGDILQMMPLSVLLQIQGVAPAEPKVQPKQEQHNWPRSRIPWDLLYCRDGQKLLMKVSDGEFILFGLHLLIAGHFHGQLLVWVATSFLLASENSVWGGRAWPVLCRGCGLLELFKSRVM